MIRALWRERQATFEGRFYRLRDALAEPKPVQRPHPPITIAGAGERRLLPVGARHADAWSSFGSPAVFRHKIEVLRRCCGAEQRGSSRSHLLEPPRDRTARRPPAPLQGSTESAPAPGSVGVLACT